MDWAPGYDLTALAIHAANALGIGAAMLVALVLAEDLGA